MKRCPECRRDYYDETLLYCLDDGTALLDGPASGSESLASAGGAFDDGPQTAILQETAPPAETATGEQVHMADQTAVLPEGTDEIALKPGLRKRLILVPIVLAVIAMAGFFGYRNFAPTRQIESIAVMPFVNNSGSADLEYLSDGMTETLINGLSQLPNLNVKAWSSVFRYKGKEMDAPAIGRELNVQAILNGRVIQRGDGLTLYLELVDATTGNRIWGEQYDRKQSDLVSLQREVARDVASKLQAKLTSADQQKLAKNYTSSPEAYQLYLQGRSSWNKRGAANQEIAIGYYQQAINIDPNFALAFAGLADAYAQPTQQPAGMPKARQAALKALQLDNNLAEAHTVYGRILLEQDYDFTGAEREIRLAIELNPNYAQAHYRYGMLLKYLGRFEAAEVAYHRALDLEPSDLVFNVSYGTLLTSARRYDEAIAQLEKTLELDPKFFLTRSALIVAYQLKGNYADSVEAQARRAGSPENAARIRESFAKGGWEGYLRFMTTRVEGTAQAEFYAALGEKDKAFAAFNLSVEKHDGSLHGIKVDPRLDPLRNDPRFAELLKKVGFPE